LTSSETASRKQYRPANGSSTTLGPCRGPPSPLSRSRSSRRGRLRRLVEPSARSTTATGGCEDVDAPAPRDDGGATAPTERSTRTDLDARRSTRPAARSSSRSTRLGPGDRRVARLARARRLLRRHRLPPHRPGLRDPGRRPDPERDGGPGYSTVDRRGRRALHEGRRRDGEDGAEPAGTAGSQFFVVTGDDVGLPPEYAIVGTVTSGLDVVERIGQLGDPATEQPLQPVVIRSVTAARP
jgi:hypothetical protein